MADTKERKTRLALKHYRRAFSLHFIFHPSKGEEPPRSYMQRVNLHFNRLIKETGITREGLGVKEAYLAAIRALIRQTGSDMNKSVKGLWSALDDWDNFRRRAYKAEQEQQQESKTPQLGSVRIKPDDQRFTAFGLLGGDSITVQHEPSPRPGELIFFRPAPNERWIVGRFDCWDKDEDGERELVFNTVDAQRYGYTNVEPYRVKEISRTVTPERPPEQAERPAVDESGPSPETLARIEELKERLDRLYEPENERAYFKTLREIWDLEHPAEQVADEWPEVIAV